MSALLSAELLKLRTTRTFLALAGAAAATSVVITVLVGLLTEPTRASVVADLFTSDTSSFFILVLAVVGISGEWRHRTIASSLLAAPDRVRFLAAKTLAFAAAGVALSLLVSLVVTVAGVAVVLARDLPLPAAGELAAQLARNAVVAGLLGGFGVGIGALVRNQVVAIVGLLLLTFALEPALLALAPEVARFGPTGALATAVSGVPAEDVGMAGVDLLPPWLAAAVLLGWIGATFAASAVLLRRRDLG